MSIFFNSGEPVTHIKLNKISVKKGTFEEMTNDSDYNTIWYITDHHNYVKKNTNDISLLNTNDIGSIEIFAGTNDNIPGGWLLCDGRELDREDYKGLFDVIGTTFGIGDGSTTFNIPDMVSDGKFAYQGEGQYIGENSHTLTIAELARHRHSALSTSFHNNPPIPGSTSRGVYIYTSSVGGSQPHENRPSFIRMRYIIKA